MLKQTVGYPLFEMIVLLFIIAVVLVYQFRFLHNAYQPLFFFFRQLVIA